MSTLYINVIFLFLVLSPHWPDSGMNATSEAPNYLVWNEHYQLQWFDFKGQYDSSTFGDAGTAIRIEANPFIHKKQIYYDVYALFIPGKSWVKDPSPELLAHERLHFDIAELYARKVRAKVKLLQQQNERDPKVYNRAVKLLLDESNQIDQEYDMETLHGGLRKQQKKWELLIQQKLAALESYQNTNRVVGRANK